MNILVFILLGTFIVLTIVKYFSSKKAETIEIVPYDSRWPKIYENEAETIKKSLGDTCQEIHHIGSTAIPGLSAKPKIDILAVVNNFSDVDVTALQQLGYKFRGEIIPTGRYLAKKNPNVHLHLFEKGNPLIEHYLLFRNWLCSHDADRIAYENFKIELAKIHKDGMTYAKAKTEFINQIVKKAKKIQGGV